MGTLLETNIGVGGVGGGVGLPGGTKVELAFDLQEPAFQSDHFRMYDFKVKRCPRARPHDWTACPFAHPGEKAKRRDPRRYRYSGTACPDFRKTGVCRRGDACPYSHGVFECWLHPSRYRTQMCTDGPSCRRRVCFFAHFEHELRRAEEYPPLLNTQLHAGLVAEARSLQQQQLAQALSGILGSPAPALGGGGGPAALESLMNVQLLKTLSQQTSGSLLPTESAPATPTGLSGLSPSSTLGGLGGGAAPPLSGDSAHLLLQLQLMQQQQAGGALRTTLSDASQQSGSSPGGSPRLVGGAGGDAFAGGDAGRQGASPAFQGDEASQLARLLQHQHQHQSLTHAQLAGGAAAIDPALLAALRNLGLGTGGGVPEGLDLASARRSIDNGALSRPSGADNYLAAAAAALASGTALGALGAAPAQPPASSPATLLNTTTGGSLPSQSFMAAAAAALQGGGGPAGAAHGVPDVGEPSLSLDHILAELPRSASQVKLPTQ